VVKQSGTTGTPPPHAPVPERATETGASETFRRPDGACRICLEKPVVVTNEAAEGNSGCRWVGEQAKFRQASGFQETEPSFANRHASA
jgi:hypothetical protein